MKQHPEFTNYLITKDGKVINKKTNRKLKPRTTENGYVIICLYKNKKSHNKRVNRLVLETYNPIENQHLYHAHHENEVRDDNNLKNLKWELIPDHLSEHHKGKVVSEETRRKIGEKHKGLRHTEEARRKISGSLKGVKKSDEARKRMSEAKKGRVLTEETRRKLSESQKGRVHSEETKRKMGESQKGHLVSDETRRNISESLKKKGFRPPSQKGTKWWNNGTRNIMSKECPGNGWVRGRCRPRP